MLILVAAALGGGLATAALLGPVSPLAALITAPFVASAMAVLASFLLAWRGSRETSVLDAQTDAMVAALRTLTEQASPTSPAPKDSADRHRVA
ncbi:hypothetical protein SAMN05216360_1059 [Methylobacterium phyllostachyos]|uniref:Holin-X, holin superfamily III n=1 Tax=Methylobacterium phyllostachyos TaxID=582672 RepID=A0A1G9XSZ3_9HYPH|nr:hypothetical protein [Methylobacterium phyllostachyos]SDM99536.1 hypothetical protein SAMN05216360_1059 [Methylobacterium phyllostachyos]